MTVFVVVEKFELLYIVSVKNRQMEKPPSSSAECLFMISNLVNMQETEDFIIFLISLAHAVSVIAIK